MFCQRHKPNTEHSKQYVSYSKSTYLLLMFLSFLRARINVLTKDTFESKLLFFVNRIEFDSICLKKLFFPHIG